MEEKNYSQMEQGYRNKITLLSFCLAVLVVIRHACNYKIYNISGVYLKFQLFITQLTDIAVPTFFMMSGYLFFVKFDYSCLLKKYKKRVFSILIPYLVWSFIAYVYTATLSSVPKISQYINYRKVSFSLKSMVLCTIKGSCNIMWFLQNLMIYIVVAPVFYLILKNKKLGYMPAIATLIVGAIINNSIVSYGTLYLLGAYFGCCFSDKIIELKFKNYLVYIATSFLLLISALRLLFIDKLGKISFVYYILLALEVVLVWIAFDFLRNGKVYSFTKDSFYIYCAHSLLLEAIEKCILLAFKNTTLGSVFDLVFAPIITIVVLLAFSFIMKKILPKFWSFVCGGRG